MEFRWTSLGPVATGSVSAKIVVSMYRSRSEETRNIAVDEQEGRGYGLKMQKHSPTVLVAFGR